MEKRKLTISVDFNYSINPENVHDNESDEWVRGLVTNMVANAGLNDLVDNVGAKIKQGFDEHDWQCEALHISHTIEVSDLNGKKKIGKKRTEVEV